MKEITRTQEVTLYIASDGEEFENKNYCIRYEQTLELKRRVEEAGEAIKERLNIRKLTKGEYSHLFYLGSDSTESDAKILLAILFPDIRTDRLFTNFEGEGWYVIRYSEGGDYSESAEVFAANPIIAEVVEILDIIKGE